MSEDKVYKDGDIVWVKLGNNWWPGEVTGPTRHPEGLIKHLKRAPYCVVKFFNENTYEYVRSSKQIFPFQCAKQEEFIRKGYSLYNSGNSFMEKFPSDVEVAKKLISRKESSLIINDRPDSIVKAILGQPLIRTYDDYCDGSECAEKRRSGDSVTKILNITPNCNKDVLPNNEQTKCQTSATNSLPDDKSKNVTNSAASNSSNYQCNLCDFTSMRLNVMILHRKMHNNRNSLGSSNSTPSKQNNAKLAQTNILTTGTTTTIINIDKNEKQRNQMISKDKNTKKTKVNATNSTPVRVVVADSTIKETNSATPPICKTSAKIDVRKSAAVSTTTSEKTNDSKTSKKSTEKEKKAESAYATILSDFCSSESEASPHSEEKRSRRSLRHYKNVNENRNGKVSTICIDLSESKVIKKIPKKREYTSSQMQSSTILSAGAEPDVVCLGDKEAESSAVVSSSKHFGICKGNADDIRRMLLADWSDDDETAPDAIIVDDGILEDNMESNECLFTEVNVPRTSSGEVISSTPVSEPSSASTGRIRNIPKKDRRDVVLQDFNSDLSAVQNQNDDKTLAVDLDSSNSSVVEIIEDKQLTAVITINDDEEQEISESEKNQTDLITTESRDNNSAGTSIDDKSASAPTSTTTRSCFDFQEEEDEQDNNSTTISHYKKKYLSVDKLHSVLSSITEELREANQAAISQNELAEKDKRLTAEIETLLEQTQPPLADLLNTNSFEENILVKDLPIKERGKRIFKSRNKTRLEDKMITNFVALTSAEEVSSPLPAEAVEEYKSNANTVELNLKSDKDAKEPEPEPELELELTADKQRKIISDQESYINKKCLIDNLSQDISISAEMMSNNSKCFHKQLPLNENKENEASTRINSECLEVRIDNQETFEEEENLIERTKDTGTGNEEPIENFSAEQESSYENHENDKDSSRQILIDRKLAKGQKQAKSNTEQEGFVTADQAHIATEKPLEEESHDGEVIENINKNCHKVETITKDVLNKGDEEIAHNLPEFENIKNNTENSNVQICELSEEKDKSDIAQEQSIRPIVRNSLDEMIINIQNAEKKEEAFTPSESDAYSKNTNKQEQCLEAIFKIRVKSPDQLFEQTIIGASQQEPDLQPAADSNADTRLITTTPTDENSSMCASDTGAEFGSPTSMLSEERLPAFRFQTNKSPQNEIETAETETKTRNMLETVQEETNPDSSKSLNSDKLESNFKRREAKKHINLNHKLPYQRRFSMDCNSLQTEVKSFKRQRLSVDEVTNNYENLENNPGKRQEGLNSLKTPQYSNEIKVRPKSRHMKITPRRNVSDLFKLESPSESHVQKNTQNNSGVDSVRETESAESVVDTAQKEPSNEIINANEALHAKKATKQNEVNHKIILDNATVSEIAKNEDKNEEGLNKISEEHKENGIQVEVITNTTSIEKIAESNEKNEFSFNVKAENPSEFTTNVVTIPEGPPSNQQENQQTDLKSNLSDDDTFNTKTNKIDITKDKSLCRSISIDLRNENISKNIKHTENIHLDSAEIRTVDLDKKNEELKNNLISGAGILLDNGKTCKGQVVEEQFPSSVPTPTHQEQEVVIESENLKPDLSVLQEVQTNVDEEGVMKVFPLTLHAKEAKNEMINQTMALQEEHVKEIIDLPRKLEDDKLVDEEVCSLSSFEKESSNVLNNRPIADKKETSVSKCKILKEPSTRQQPLETVIEFENNVTLSDSSKEINIVDERESENVLQIPSTHQVNDLIIERRASTPQDITECDSMGPAQVTPEKEVIVESEIAPVELFQNKDIVTEENSQLKQKENLLESEMNIVIQPKENTTNANTHQETRPNVLQTDADKAAEEFLIEFDSIVNHSQTVEEDVPICTAEGAINAEDLINNIIEEVHEDTPVKQDALSESESPLQYEPLTTYTVVTPKNSWNQIFKDSFKKKLPSAKRRQTICFEVSDTKEGVACKKQAFDFESMLPANKTIKRTAERKLTLPAIETKLSSSHQAPNILTLNTNQITINKKLMSTTKRKLSIEDNITSFIIERPKPPQQAGNGANGPPPLQRIKPLNRQNHTISKISIENMPEPPPLQSHDNFPSESSSPTLNMDLASKGEGGRVTLQQIISSPTISSNSQNKSLDSQIAKNKQIGVDSRGNKYVIIKTPQTDIVVQPTLTSATATNNFGTTITIQPLARSSQEGSVTKAITKNKSIPSTPTVSSRKQLQQQQMKQISITLPAKSALEVSNSPEIAAKTQFRNRRKAAHAKAIAAAHSNVNSDKHRQAMEALSRRLSVTSEAPPLAKLSRTSSAHVQTLISNNNNLTTFFGDAQISNIAQQQLMHLQQQQQQQQQIQTSQPPPVILNKNAHQQSVIRKTRKIPQQLQQKQQQQHLQNQQQTTATISQQQQPQMQQQQQQIITHITAQQQQTQQNNSLQPPPLQQIQSQTVPMQQQAVQQSDGIIITTATTEDDNVIDSNTQLIALPTQPYPGYAETFLLCKVKGNTCKPVDNVPLYLNHQLNELVPVPLEAIESGQKSQAQQIEIKTSETPQPLLGIQNNERQTNESNMQIENLNCNLLDGEMSTGTDSELQIHQHHQTQQIMEECVIDENGASSSSNNQISEFASNQEVNTDFVSNNGILLNIEGQQVLLDAATFAHLLANPDANTQLISDDGTEYVLTHEVLAALQMQQEQQQALELANAATGEQQQHPQLEQTSSSDILAVALAGSDLYDNDVLTIDTSQGMRLIDGNGSIVFPAQTGAITQQHLTPPAVVTNAVLDQSPIMSTLEVPSSIATTHKLQGTQLITVPSHHLATSNAALGMGARTNLEDSLAAIGVTTQPSNIPSSLGLPITVTNPSIASKVTSAGPLNEMLQFVSHRPATAAATAAAVAAAALAGESRIFTD